LLLLEWFFHILEQLERFWDTELSQQFLANNGANGFLDLFKRFGTTSMPSAIENLKALGKVRFQSDHLERLSGFIVATDLTIRLGSTELICTVVEESRFEDTIAFPQIARNALQNTKPETIEGLLTASIRLLAGLAALPSLIGPIHANHGAVKLIHASRHINPIIVRSALDLVNVLLTSSVSVRFVQVFITEFPGLFKTWNNDNRERGLRSFALMLKNQSAITEIAHSSEIRDIIGSCFHSDSPKIVLFSLKLFYSFLTNPVSFELYSQLVESLPALLTHKTESVRFVAASALGVGLEKGVSTDIVTAHEIRAFLQRCFAKNELVICALRLTGLISKTYRSATLLESVIEGIARYHSAKDQKVRNLALEVFSSCACSNPISPTLLKIIEKIKKIGDLPDSVLTFLAYMTLNRAGAVHGAKLWKQIANAIAERGNRAVSFALLALDRIAQTPDTLEILTNEDISAFISVSKPLLEKEDTQAVVFSILESLVYSDKGKQTVRQSNLPVELKKIFVSVPRNAPVRISLMRILACIG
jgi:hypothetical protein